MKKFNRYKVSPSEVGDLMGNEQGYRPPTETDLKEFLRILDKDQVDITEKQIMSAQALISKRVDFENEGAPISGSTKKNIYKHYVYARFGANKISRGGDVPIQLEKGEVAEPDAIKLLSKIDGVEYQKNYKLFQNAYFKGIPDILLYENDKIIGIKDIKIPIDLVSFIERVDGDHLTDDKWEMLAYLDILGLKEGEICYCLVDLPKNSRDQRIDERKKRCVSLGYSPEHIRKIIKNFEKSMIYDYIPDEKKVVRFKVTRRGYFTAQMHKRVKTARERMANLHKKFENGLFLPEIDQPSEENMS